MKDRVDAAVATGVVAVTDGFDRAGQLMSYVGLVPSENSTGESRRQGPITKTGSGHARRLRARPPAPGTPAGSGHARRLLVEAAWHYRKTPSRGATLKRRQHGQPANIITISWQAQQRVHRVWQRLAEQRGKRSTIVAVAVARELAGFCWALARSRRSSTDVALT